MKRWPCPLWVIIALVALLANLMPSLAFACPMTGRVGNITAICQHSSGSSTLPPCCQHPGDGKCCKKIPQLPGSGKDIAAPASAVSQVALLIPQFTGASNNYFVAALPAAPLFIDLKSQARSYNQNISPLLSHHFLPASAGRAPPPL